MQPRTRPRNSLPLECDSVGIEMKALSVYMPRSLLATLAILDGIYTPQDAESVETISSDKVMRALREHPLGFSRFSPETIASFLDCELPEEEKTAFENECENDPVLLAETACLHRIITKQLRNIAPTSEECRHRLYAIQERCEIPETTTQSPELVLSEIHKPATAKSLSAEKCENPRGIDTECSANAKILVYSESCAEEHENLVAFSRPESEFHDNGKTIKKVLAEFLRNQQRLIGTLLPLFVVLFLVPIIWKSGIIGNNPQPEAATETTGNIANRSTQVIQEPTLVEIFSINSPGPGLESAQPLEFVAGPVPPPKSQFPENKFEFALPDVNELVAENPEKRPNRTETSPTSRNSPWEVDQPEDIRLAAIPASSHQNRAERKPERPLPEQKEGRYGPYSDPWSFAPMSHLEEESNHQREEIRDVEHDTDDSLPSQPLPNSDAFEDELDFPEIPF